MSIKNIKLLSMNPHFYAMILNSFFNGYGKPCKITTAFLVLPILMYEQSREKLQRANKMSKIDTVFQSPLTIGNEKISSKTRVAGFGDRYELFKQYTKESLIILYSEKKIEIKNYNIEIIRDKKVDFKNYSGEVKIWLRCAYYLGIILANASKEKISYYLGVNIK